MCESGKKLSEYTYKIIEVVETGDKSWKDAAKNAVEQASKSLKDLRIGEITKMDIKIEDGKVIAYRTRFNLNSICL